MSTHPALVSEPDVRSCAVENVCADRASSNAAPFVLHARVVTGAGGGPEKTILNSPRFLAPLGYRSACLYLHPPGDPGQSELRRRADEAGAELIGVEDKGAFDLGVIRRVLKVCRETRAAVWHAHDYKTNLLGLVLRRFHPLRLVTTVHGWVERTSRTPLYFWIDRKCLPRYERVMCVSSDLEEACLAAGVRRERCMLIENGIDAATWRRPADRSALRAAFDLAEGAVVVGGLGRLSEEKGFDRLIAATDRLLESGRNVVLLIAGEGGARADLERRIAETGRGDRVRLVGFQKRPQDFLAALDVFALSSLREGLPNVVLEAMSLELPVVATEIAGVPRVITDGTNGLIVPPDDVDALARSLDRLVVDAGLRARLGTAARETIVARFDFGARMRKEAAVYDELLGRSDSGSSEKSDGGKLRAEDAT